MSTAVVLVNVASLSTSLGALIALAVIFILYRSRGALLLMGTVILLAADYVIGLILYAHQGSPLWLGLGGFPAVRRWATMYFGVKGLIHVVMLVTAPLAVFSFLGARPGRALLWAGAAVCLASTAVLVCLISGLLPAGGIVVFAASALPVYLAYAACFVILLRLRNTLHRSGMPRVTLMAALAGIGLFTPALIAADILGLAGVAGPLPVSPIAFVVLMGGILVFSLLSLAGGRRGPAAVDVEGFCAAKDLSVREREVLLLLVKGMRYKQIAEQLYISVDTVKSHVSRIYRKTSASGKTDLMYRIRG